MKVPFRQQQATLQVTEYDCVPVSIISGLSYLFRRREIPPFVVHRIYKECLDYEGSRGTTSRAIMDIGHWLTCYREKSFPRFAVAATYLAGTQVRLKDNSKIIDCLANGGVVALCVQTSQYERHCLLALDYSDDWLYCHEPLPRSKRFIQCDQVQFIEQTGHHAANVRIHRIWLEKNYDKVTQAKERKYVLGSIHKRECLLLKRLPR
ncbi:MAG: hypothetical protein HXX11_14875 [Desulfuromonadales bacterium]|nr:hypothetical protein [Desulfuromonadales bacterium]